MKGRFSIELETAAILRRAFGNSISVPAEDVSLVCELAAKHAAEFLANADVSSFEGRLSGFGSLRRAIDATLASRDPVGAATGVAMADPERDALALATLGAYLIAFAIKHRGHSC